MDNPYKGLPQEAFWRSGVADPAPDLANIYKKRFAIGQDDRCATAGSCFAQHIARNLRERGYQVIDAEPAPPFLPRALHESFGYSMYSARYGNIYTVQQLLQLAREAFGLIKPDDFIWERKGRYFDAFRPGVEPEGHKTPDEVRYHRQRHLAFVRKLFTEMDVFVFTLGLTEHWASKESGSVYPMAPGTIAGSFDPDIFEFRNAGFNDIMRDFKAFDSLLMRRRRKKPLRYLLTVSPVPLTATYSGRHVLSATTYSKSVLRAAAGALYEMMDNVDYFPSFEIVTNPGSRSINFASNLRSVRPAAVATVMETFFAEHGAVQQAASTRISALDGEAADPPGGSAPEEEFVKCEEQLLESFNGR